MNHLQLSLFCCLLFIGMTHGQDAPKETKKERKKYFTQRITSKAPSIDGKLDDAAWEQVEWSGDYIQRIPNDNQAPTQNTAFKILYDDKYLYIGARCYDTEPDKIVKRMSRRDGFEGDWVEFNIDSYYDMRTAFSFTISASGVKGDEFISNDGGNWDTSWDPIWYADVNIDDEGWTAEIKIPFSQLRYGNKESHIWGLQSTRRDFRMAERSLWQHVPQGINTWVSEFGELHGLDGIKPQKQIELQPYVVLKADSYEPEQGNPFRTGSDFGINGGLDGKIGVTSDLVLDFTINPDFGQVEADPAALRLDGFENFFQERRPFFVENRNLFNGGFNGGNLFYSRRIGGAPKGYPSLGTNEYPDMPQNTTIWGAAKFSGKTSKGLSIGIMESITAEERANIRDVDTGMEREEVIEPLTNYFVGKFSQDFSEGRTVVGGMFTAMNRDLRDTNMDWLRGKAYSGMAEVFHRWNDQEWFFQGKGMFSVVKGSEESILNTQTSIQRLYQRPDASHLNIDSTATSLGGYGGTLLLGKNSGNNKLNFEASLRWISPGFELNDMGFLGSADKMEHGLWMYYRIGKPFSIFRNMRFNYSYFTNFDTRLQNRFINMGTNHHAQFNNFWGYGIGMNTNFNNKPTAALRGGPTLYVDPNISQWMYIESDSRKKVSLFVNVFNVFSNQNVVRTTGLDFSVTYRPINTLEIRISPEYNRSRRALQYVSNLDLQDGTRYINASINQKTFGTSIRVNYNIKPNLTIQYYGQPFISKGEYFNFKNIINPLEKDVNERIDLFENITYDEDNYIYAVDENGDGSTDFEINDPDFVFMQFRSNLVMRWEYIPGSELFFVWSQGTNSFTGDARDQKLFPYLRDQLFPDEKINNTFLIKATYRFLK